MSDVPDAPRVAFRPALGVPLRRALTWALAVVLAAALWVRWWHVPWLDTDLRVYLAGAHAALGHGSLYSLAIPDGHGGLLRFTYPPVAALLFVPLRWSGAAAGPLMALLSVAATAVSAAVCGRAAGWGTRAGVALVLVAMVLEPVQRTLLFGQVNLVLMALVLVDAFVVPRQSRGWLTGLAAGVKLTPAVFVVYYLIRREWGSAARMGLSFGLTVLLGWVALPAESARFWLHDLGTMRQFGPEVELWGNQSLSGVMARAVQLHGIPPTLVHVVTLALSAAVLVLGVVAARRQSVAGDHLAALVAVALVGLLVSPVSWTHHWVWVVPALVVLVRRRWWVLTAVTVLGFFLPPMWALHDRPDSELGYTAPDLALSGAFVVWALAVLVTLLTHRTVTKALPVGHPVQPPVALMQGAPTAMCDDSGGNLYSSLGEG